MLSSPAIGSDGTVYVGSKDNKLYAINGKSGVKLWEFETGGEVNSSPAIGSDGTVYVGSYDKKLYAIKTESQRPSQKPVAHAWPECSAHGSCAKEGITPRFSRRHSRASRDEVLHHLAVHIGEPVIASAMAEGEPFMVQPQ